MSDTVARPRGGRDGDGRGGAGPTGPVARGIAALVVGVLIVLYSSVVDTWVSLDGLTEPIVWISLLTTTPLFVALLLGVAAYNAYRRGSFFVGWGVLAVPWTVGFVQGPRSGPVVYSFLTLNPTGSDFGVGELLATVSPAVAAGLAYALPFAAVGYLVGRGLGRLDAATVRSTLRLG